MSNPVPHKESMRFLNYQIKFLPLCVLPSTFICSWGFCVCVVDGSVGKAPALKAQDPELHPQNLCEKLAVW